MLTSANSCNGEISLTLDEPKFPNNTIYSQWLKGLKFDINQLTISSTTLSVIEERAFAGTPFTTSSQRLQLTISDSRIKYLGRNVFEGSNIQIFQIRSIADRSLSFEKDVFAPLAYTLQTLQIQRLLDNSEGLTNITAGETKLSKLEGFDLRYNTLPIIPENSFVSAPNLIQLWLCSCSISKIELGAFNGLGETLKQIFIKDNLIETLPKGLLKNFKSILFEIWVNNNPWRCDCKLQWLKDYLLLRNNTDPLMCEVNGLEVNFTEVEFCSITSTDASSITSNKRTTRTTTTDATSVATTTTDDDEPSGYIYKRIFCRNITAYPYQNYTNSNKVYLQEAYFKTRNVDSTLYQIEDSSTFAIKFHGVLNANDYLIWSNVENTTEYGCAFDITSNVYMNLEYDNVYTICLTRNDTVDSYALVSKDCTAFNTPIEWGNQPWLPNDQMVPAILTLVFSALLAALIASISVYFIIRQYPELIKGNKRIVVVKKKSSPDFLIMPSYESKRTPLSVYTNSEGYLTPKNKRYAKIGDVNTDVLAWSSDKDEKLRTLLAENFYEPPPLPPGHPSEGGSNI